MSNTTTTPTATVDPAELAELERLAQAATPGPWEQSEDCIYQKDNDALGIVAWATVGHHNDPRRIHDAAFIAAACNAALPLVAQLRAEQAAREAAQLALVEEENYHQSWLDDTRENIASTITRCETAERERDEARQRAAEAERERVDACQLVASFPHCDCGHIFPMHTADGCAECLECIGYTHGVKNICLESPFETQLRQRAERAEACEAEMQAMLELVTSRPTIQRNFAELCRWCGAEENAYDGYRITHAENCEFVAARALLARTGAERKDGGERVA